MKMSNTIWKALNCDFDANFQNSDIETLTSEWKENSYIFTLCHLDPNSNKCQKKCWRSNIGVGKYICLWQLKGAFLMSYLLNWPNLSHSAILTHYVVLRCQLFVYNNNIHYKITVWKFQNFSITHILREIKVGDFWGPKTDILTQLEALNFDFINFCIFWRLKLTKSTKFWGTK